MEAIARSPQQADRRQVLRGLGGGLLGVLLGTVLGWPFSANAGQTADSILRPVPRRPRPTTLSPALFRGKVARAYQIAREVPELVEQMPCYCGCFKSNSHQNNLDCYVDRHAVG